MTEPKKRPQGRPDLGISETVVILRCPREFALRVKIDALRQGISKSEWLRRAAIKELEINELKST